jgi:CheY-like chemotaxis protein/HPt (histidine-containing phosphotransfer) domain-containing protein
VRPSDLFDSLVAMLPNPDAGAEGPRAGEPVAGKHPTEASKGAATPGVAPARTAEGRAAPGGSGARAPGARAPGAMRGHVLLAEDNPTNQQVALGVLGRLGLTAEAVGNGKEAVAALAAKPYDLVLMDVEMPEMDGLTATATIRAPGSGVLDHAIPIVAMTAYAMSGDRERCLAAGMNDYIAKPLSRQALVAALERWLPAQALPAQAPLERTLPRRAPAPGAQLPASVLVGSPGVQVFDKEGAAERLGDAEIAALAVEAYLENAGQQVAALREAVASGDAAAIARRAHAVKGEAATVGGERVRAIAQVMEQRGKAGDAAGAGAPMAELDAEFRRLRAAMRE